MKKYLIIAIIFLVYGCGTDQAPPRFYDYTLLNNSGYNVEITPFNWQGNKLINNKITLLNNKSLNQKYRDDAPYGGFGMKGLLSDNFKIGGWYKIEIVFNNSKKIIYNDDCTYNNGISTNCSPRNIFLLEYSNEKTETYTITPEDYQNAIDCGGNCN